MWLKILACLLMLLDHFGLVFQAQLSPGLYFLLRLLGRLAFPAFAYLFVCGLRRTRDIKRYFLRMLLFGLATQALFALIQRCFGLRMWTNVLFTFAFGLLLLLGLDLLRFASSDVSLLLKRASAGAPGAPPPSDYAQRVSLYGLSIPRRLAVPLALALIALCLALTLWLAPDYGLYGLVTMVIFHCYSPPLAGRTGADPGGGGGAGTAEKAPGAYLPMFIVFALFNLILSFGQYSSSGNFSYSFLQSFSCFAVPLFPLAFTGRRPGRALKWFFYAYYPLHLFLLAALHRFFI